MSVNRPLTRPRAAIAFVAAVALTAGLTTLGAPPAAAAANPPVRITDGTRDSYAASVSDDGRYVLYTADPTNQAGTNGFVSLRDRQTATSQQVGPTGASGGEISADGSTAVYTVGQDKTCGNTTEYVVDVFLWTRATNTSAQISPTTCTETYRTPRLSANGQQVVYDETSFDNENQIDSVHLYDVPTATPTNFGAGYGSTISDNGRFVAWVGTDDTATLIVFDRTAAVLFQVTGGVYGVAPVSSTGRYITYDTDTGVVSLDRITGATIQIDTDSGASLPDQSPDGRYIAYPGNGDIGGSDQAAVWDRTTGNVVTVGSADAETPSVSADGQYVAYDSDLSEGVAGDDTGGNFDVFLFTRGAAAPHTAAESFVTAAFQDYIGRAPGPVERSFGLAIVGNASSIQKRAQFTTGLAQSDTYLGAVVNKLYVDTLGRTGDSGGVAYWTNQLRTGKVTVAQTAGLFYASPEYFAGFGNNNLTTWVTDLYHKVLLREPDSGGLAYYVDLAQRTNRYTVAYPFYQSLESSRTRTNALYQHFLQRPADQGGLDYWASRIPSLGDVALASNLTLSDEYLSKAATRFP